MLLQLLSSPRYVHVQKEIEDIIRVGYLNGLFVLARSIGLIGRVTSESSQCVQSGL
jgi:hypothetical protein